MTVAVTAGVRVVVGAVGKIFVAVNVLKVTAVVAAAMGLIGVVRVEHPKTINNMEIKTAKIIMAALFIVPSCFIGGWKSNPGARPLPDTWPYPSFITRPGSEGASPL